MPQAIPITEPEEVNDVTPVTTEVASPEVADSAPSLAPQQLVEFFRKQGYEIEDGATDDRIIRQLEEIGEKASKAIPDNELTELRQYAEYGRRVAPRASDFEAFLAQQQEASAKKQAEPAQAKPWDPPQFDEAWLEFCTFDDKTNRYRPKAPELLRYAEAANARTDYMSKWTRQFQANPYETMKNGLQQEWQTAINPLAGEIAELRKQLSDLQAERYINSDEGKALQRHYDAIPDELGLNPQERLQYAETAMKLERHNESKKAAAKKRFVQEEVADEDDREPIRSKAEEFLSDRKKSGGTAHLERRAASKANGHGSIPPGQQRFADLHRQILADDGVDE